MTILGLALILLLLLGVVAIIVALRQARANEQFQKTVVDLENTLSMALQLLTKRCETAEKVADKQAETLGAIAMHLETARPDTANSDFLRHLVVGLQEQIQQNSRDSRAEAAKANARVLALIDSKAEGLVTGQALRANGHVPVLDDLHASPPDSVNLEPIRYPEGRMRRAGEAIVDYPEPPSIAGTQYDTRTETGPEPLA